MSKYLDKGKVEQAFRRAARTAVSGSKEARSGRFVAAKESGKTGAHAQRSRKQK